MAPDHPRAVVSLILGILGILLCSVVAPFALVIGRRTVKEIDASGGTLGGRGMAQAGYILGIIGTVLLALIVVGGVTAAIVAAATS
jgi:hypothetical protein